MIINSDSLMALKEIEDNSIDAVITDPPYGYSFMGKDWDKAVPSVEIWQECLRVLKPGGWCMVMSAPRSDVQNAMISRLQEAGFRLDFTPIYWTYASGFPKAGNVGKLVDKRLGAEREVVGKRNMKSGISVITPATFNDDAWQGNENVLGGPVSPEAKALDGSYAGFQPKPAVEVIIVAMKPLSEKTYVDQALKNGKGITWLDDCRVPIDKANEPYDLEGKVRPNKADDIKWQGAPQVQGWQPKDGRFPANLLVSDDVLNDGVERKTNSTGKGIKNNGTSIFGNGKYHENNSKWGDSGSYSRYFDLDKWAQAHLTEQQMSTFPFAIFPKASKSEKNKGLDSLEDKAIRHQVTMPVLNNGRGSEYESHGKSYQRSTVAKNHHPTVKPLKLMSYLITLTTREGDTVLDPFVGSGTTVVAANSLNRKGIGIEREEEYAEIARARVEANRPEPQLALEGE